MFGLIAVWRSTISTRDFRRGAAALLAVLVSAGCGGERSASQAASPGAVKPAPAEKNAPEPTVERAEELLELAKYQEAERMFAKLLQSSDAKTRARAQAGLLEIALSTGRYEEAARKPAGVAASTELTLVRAEALRRLGRLDEALEVLASAPTPPYEVPLLRGKIQLARGAKAEAETAFMTLISAYNRGDISEKDGRDLALVGRAADFLRSPHDANDAFDQAEAAAPGDVRTLLFRTELFLEKYDTAHAEETLTEVLRKAPNHPEALVLAARVQMDKTLDFDEAERLCRAALAVNENLAEAWAVLAGISLRDSELSEAESRVERGLSKNPGHLELLSLRATARFLADDEAGFEEVRKQVFEQNPLDTRFYRIVGEYADWEHRYDDIVKMMRQAVRIDPDDGAARAELGLNLIRAGRDAAGVVELRRSFESDPFNVRVYNTLELYERIIPRDYVSERRGRFRIRYPKQERDLLDRYVPDLLDRAFASMEKRYGFAPEEPIGVELYAKRSEFSVRTSGLPQTAIQGVCFGRTLAALSLSEEQSNLGMTLWHELAHVFHIQLSRSRVPRWFTEGLAEHETAVARPEWRRELDLELYVALRADRVPHLGQMGRAFTRAEDIQDIATAYYASTKIAEFLRSEVQDEGLRRMLEQWGAGEPTPEVTKVVTGHTLSDVDRRFRADLEQRLAPFQKQFVPLQRRGATADLKSRAEREPNRIDAQLAYALALFDEGETKQVEGIIQKVLEKSPEQPDARFLQVRLKLAASDADSARKDLEKLVEGEGDGFETRMLLGRLTLAAGDRAAAEKHFEAARKFHPEDSAPLVALGELARRDRDGKKELEVLREVTRLEEHAGEAHRRYLTLLVENGRYDEALEAGEAAIWANMADVQTHLSFARALDERGDKKRALFEYESAALVPARPEEQIRALSELAQAYRQRGREAQARDAERRAAELVPQP